MTMGGVIQQSHGNAYNEQYGEQWTYRGAGFLLVNDFTNEVVVLEQDKHIDQKGIRLQFTDKGQALFSMKESPSYNYWFDIITTNRQDQVLANYEWELTEEGKGLLEANEIPLDFAAVIQTQRKTSTNYYFAGDYNDVEKVPQFYQVKGLATFYRYAQRFSDNSFYKTEKYQLCHYIHGKIGIYRYRKNA